MSSLDTLDGGIGFFEHYVGVGSLTKEFVVERGLKKGDPFSPFLYVIIAKGLKGLVNKAVEKWGFCGV